MLKRYIGLTAMMAAVLLIGGCGSNQASGDTKEETRQSADGDNSSKSDDGEYTYTELEDASFTFLQYSVENHENYEKLAEAYMEVHPNIDINVESSNDWRTTLKSKISSGDEPGLIMFEGPNDLADYKDLVEDLSDLKCVSYIFDDVKESCQVDGAIKAVPSAIVNYGLLYNKEIFEACGINGDELTSYDAMDEAFAVVKGKIESGELKEQFPYLEAVVSFPGADTWPWANHATNMALAQEISTATEAYQADSIEFKYADGLKDYLDLLVKYSSSPDDPSQLLSVDVTTATDSEFCLERSAVIQQGQWSISEMKAVDESILDKIGLLPIPIKGGKEDCSGYGVSSYFVVDKNLDENVIAAAKDFLDWCYLSESGKDFISNTLTKNVPFENFSDTPTANVISQLGNEQAQKGKTVANVFGGYPSGWTDSYGADIQSYLAGQMEWDQVVENAISSWEELRQQ